MIHRRLHPLMIMMLLVGCAVGPDYQQPAPLATTHWNDKGDSAVKSQTSSAATNPRWWKTFGSPQLDSLIERAIAGNLTLQQTVLRIAGAREQINQAGGAFFPSVNGNVQATRQQLGLEGELKSHGVYEQLNNVDPELRGALGPLTQPINLYQGSFDAQWEIDLWGKVRRQVEAAEAQQRAAIEQRNDALVSLEAEVARAWLQLRGAQSIIATLNTQIESAQQTLDLTESRQRGGLSPQMDVENARAQLGNLEAQLPQYQAQERQAMNGLAILLGKPPGALDAELQSVQPMPALPDIVQTGIPSTTGAPSPGRARSGGESPCRHGADWRLGGRAVPELYPLRAVWLAQQRIQLANRLEQPLLQLWPAGFHTDFRGGRLVSSVKVARAQQGRRCWTIVRRC